MIRKRYDRIPHPAQDIKRERNTSPKGDIKYKAAQAEALSNQMTTRLSKTKRTNSRIQTEIRTIHSNDNKPQRRHVSCKLSGLKPVLCARNFLLISASSQKTNEPPHDKTNKMICAFSEHSDQPGHLPSLIGVFAVRMKKAWVHSCPLSAQRRLIRLGGCPG